MSGADRVNALSALSYIVGKNRQRAVLCFLYVEEEHDKEVQKSCLSHGIHPGRYPECRL